MMNKLFCAILAVLTTIGLTACAATAAASPDATGTAASASKVVAFTDPTLEAMVRATMGRPEGDITAAEAEAVTELNLSFEWQQHLPDAVQIQNIGGLEYFTNLEHLDLSFHAIQAVSPLPWLT